MPRATDTNRIVVQIPEGTHVSAAVTGWTPRVLVVDDDEVCRSVAAGLLEHLGLVVDVASDGREALMMGAGWPYVAIFMDCGMPELDGYAAAREIARREGLSQRTPVIAVTSHSRVASLTAGMDSHIVKPLKLDTLKQECMRLGLLARVQTTSGEPVEDLNAATPAPVDLWGYGTGREAELALAFIEQAVSRLPELWRAANAGDRAALSGIAHELKNVAAAAGMARIADLCDRMKKAAIRGHTAVAAGIESQLERALEETAAAIRSSLEGTTATGSESTSHASDRERRPLVRVAIADDDQLARAAIEAMLTSLDGLELVGAAADVDEIVDLAIDNRPDVVVLDWIMPGGGGPEAASRILRWAPDTRIVALTSSDSPEAFDEMTRAGACGLLVKGGSGDELAKMIRGAVAG
jgi:CheY-like chemotaxis protein